ncbi:MAG: hypothetical protein Q8L06_15750, partial [Pseudohongiella sp.]|nr:hypothetical protein [Pseudohongiella sp.]
MSLLMEALRKAEEAKKRAALKEQEDGKSTDRVIPVPASAPVIESVEEPLPSTPAPAVVPETVPEPVSASAPEKDIKLDEFEFNFDDLAVLEPNPA